MSFINQQKNKVKNRQQVHTEAAKSLKENNGTGTLNIQTGIGKSKIVINFILSVLKTYDTVLILVPLTRLISNWVEEFEKWTYPHYSEKEQCITIVVPNGSIKIYLETVQTAYKWKNKEWTLIVLDEIHTMVTTEYQAVMKLTSTYRIGLTATIDTKGKTDKKELYKTYCPIIYSYHDGENHGIINKTKITIINHKLTNNFKRLILSKKNGKFEMGEASQYEYLTKKVRAGEGLMVEEGSTGFFEDAAKWWWNKKGTISQKTAGRKYLQSITMRKTFLLSLQSTAEIARKLSFKLLEEDLNNKVLTFSELVSQAKTICDNVVFGEQSDEDNDKLIQLFNEGKIRLLGSCYSLTLGINLVGANNAIIESYQSSVTKGTQRIGRLHRLNEDDTANIYIINVLDTQAEKWFSAMTDGLDLTNSKVIKSTEIL